MAKKKRKTKQLIVEPGNWVFDTPVGMPIPKPPDILPNKTLSAWEIRDLVSYEGLGYCLRSYIPAKRIEEKELRLLWLKAERAMQLVVDYLETLPPEIKMRSKKKVKYRKDRTVKYKVEAIDIGEEL